MSEQQKVEESYDPYGDLAKTYTDTAQAEAGQDTGGNKQDTGSNKQNLVYSSSKKDAWANSPYSEGKKDVTKNGGYGSRQRRHSTPSDSSGNSLNAVKLYMLSTVPYAFLVFVGNYFDYFCETFYIIFVIILFLSKVFRTKKQYSCDRN